MPDRVDSYYRRRDMAHAVMDPEDETAEAAAGGTESTPFRASHLWLGVGAAIATVTVLSALVTWASLDRAGCTSRGTVAAFPGPPVFGRTTGKPLTDARTVNGFPAPARDLVRR